MKKIIMFFVTLVLSVTVASKAMADWEYNNILPFSHVHNFKDEGGNIIATALGIPQYSQPTYYMCGASVLSMTMLWESHKKGRALGYDITSIHEYVVGAAARSMPSQKLSDGITKIADYINATQNLGLNIKPQVGAANAVEKAVSNILERVNINHSPVIMYGNVLSKVAGGHYYLAVGVAYCKKDVCGEEIAALGVHDSVYNSPAWGSSHFNRVNALEPYILVDGPDLLNRWKKIGSGVEADKRHYYLFNSTGAS